MKQTRSSSTSRQQQLRVRILSRRVQRNLHKLGNHHTQSSLDRDPLSNNRVSARPPQDHQSQLLPCLALLLGLGVAVLLLRKRQGTLVHLGVATAAHLLRR